MSCLFAHQSCCKTQVGRISSLEEVSVLSQQLHHNAVFLKNKKGNVKLMMVLISWHYLPLPLVWIVNERSLLCLLCNHSLSQALHGIPKNSCKGDWIIPWIFREFLRSMYLISGNQSAMTLSINFPITAVQLLLGKTVNQYFQSMGYKLSTMKLRINR